MDAYRPSAGSRLLERARSYRVAGQRMVRSVSERIRGFRDGFRSPRNADLSWLEGIRDRRRGILLGVAAGAVAAVSVIVFVEVTDAELEPLLPRLGSAFTVTTTEGGQAYIALDPAALGEDEEGVTDVAEGGSSGDGVIAPVLLVPSDEGSSLNGDGQGGTNPQQPGSGSSGPGPGGGPGPAPSPPDKDPPTEPGPGPDPGLPPGTDPPPQPEPPPGPTGPGPTGPGPTGPRPTGPTGPGATGPTGPGPSGPEPTGPAATGP